jgi:N-sulfoglucosamine sulfohydrolase
MAMPELAFAAAEPGTKRPSILLITVDDLNWDSVGVYGSKVPGVTPNIDKLAAEGIRFTNAHVQAAVCQPSRSVLMTGRYPHRNGARGFEPINPAVTTLQERVRAAGYLNGIMGKNSHLQPRGKFCWDFYITPESLEQGRAPALYYKHAKEFFEQAKAAGKPFFLMANSHDPHRPFAGSNAEINEFGKHYPYTRRYAPSEIQVTGFLPDLPDVRTELAQYFTSAHRCDETVGEVLRALSETGGTDNTLVMFLSDNGMSFPYSKTNCYLAGTKTPWIARWPGHIKPGRADSKHFISGIDYMPTIIEAAELEPVSGMDGRSFMPLLAGSGQKGRDKVFTFFEETSAKIQFPMRCVQNANYGYIYNAWSDGKTSFKNEAMGSMSWRAMGASTDPKVAARVKYFLFRTPEELYDLRSDPNCLRNLASDPKHTKTLQAMRKQLADNMASTQDPILPALEAYLATGKQTWQPEVRTRFPAETK